jgi:putative heme iron utilization protein
MTDADDSARTARRVMREAATAALSTLDRDSGAPYGSLVLATCLHDATPVVLISELAEHTRNAIANPTASVLFDGTAGLDDPLTGPRVTVVGRLEPTDDAVARARILARHPSAADYADFADFGFWRLAVERAHLVAGFGKITWIPAAALRLDTAAAADLAEREADIVGHMNAEHRDAVQLYVEHLLGGEGGGWTMTGLDPEGFDLRRGGVLRRIDFERPVHDADAARAALVALVRAARTAG